jgi:hypothetical protein
MSDGELERSHERDDIQMVNLDALQKDGTPLVPASSSLQDSRFTPRQRQIQLFVTASLVVLVLFVIIGNIVSIPGFVTRILFGPTPAPTATIVPGADLFYVQGDPTWGRLFIDGRPMAHLPRIGIDAPLRLARGQHVLSWHAEPFNMQTCRVSVPPVSSDTCAFGGSIQSNTATFAWVVYFSASLPNLPLAQQTVVEKVAQAMLDTQKTKEMVRPGEVYADVVKGGLVTATVPLTATLRFVLNTDISSHDPCTVFGQIGQPCSMLGEDCLQFCSVASAELSNAPALGWSFLAVVRTVWTFTTLQGLVIRQEDQDGYDGIAASQHLLPLRITWDSQGWHAAIADAATFPVPVDTSIACATARDEIQASSILSAVLMENTPPYWHYVASSDASLGCLALAVPHTAGDTASALPNPIPLTSAYCLYRFGVLLAANAIAHRLWPTLPLADAYERSIVKQFLRHS